MKAFIKSALIVLLVFTFSSGILHAQHFALQIGELSQHGTSIGRLDSLYRNVLDPDPNQTLFAGKGAGYYDAQVKLFNDLNAHLKKNKFTWGQPVKTMTRIYYKKDGTIDYFIYDFSKSGLSAEKQADFAKLLTTFIETYSTHVSASSGFYHRLPYTFKD